MTEKTNDSLETSEKTKEIINENKIINEKNQQNEIKNSENENKDEDILKKFEDKENNEIKNETKRDIQKMEIDLENEENVKNIAKNQQQKKIPHERSVFSLEGAKLPLSLYTRRVMNISKIEDYLKPESTKGRCGGRNLGNTCFMNSSIACLSNCNELTYYFLKGDYKKDINEENNLGMRGELAKSWAELIHQYWVENTSVGDPSDFKETIGRKAVRFRGYGQQDSNEFMSVFLDYLNEDLNRTTKKEYIELKEKGENESDEECARRFWECNLKRNDSIITDLFCGQFKSTITCPECHWINITFDPFDTINLPLLTQIKRYYYFNQIQEEINFFYVPKYSLRNPYNLTIKNIDKNEKLNDIIDRIKKEKDFIYHDKINHLFFVDMYQKEKFKYPEITESLSQFLCFHEYIFCYDLNKKEDEIEILVYFWENNDKNSSSEYPRMVFGKKDMSLDTLKKKIYIYLRKYILSPFLKENEEKDNLSLEIEKLIEDKNLEMDENKIIEKIEKEYEEVFKFDNEDENEDEHEEEKEKEKEGKNIEEGRNEIKNNENKEENIEIINGNKKKEIKDIITNKKEMEKKEEEKTNEEKEREKEKLLEKFVKNLPFKIYIRQQKIYYNNEKTIFLDKDNFNKLSKQFKELFKLKSFKSSIEKTEIAKEYEIIVEFNQESNYINKDTFKLNNFEQHSLEYIIKKEEPKNEEEDNGKMTLSKCLKKFCKEEQLEEGDEWYCPKCKKHVLAKKKMELYYLPKILIICFKRFVKDSYRWEKNDDEVEFPINDMDLKEFVIGPDRDKSKYDLFAVSQHYGSTGFGHYTAVCKNNGQWYSYNDSSCVPTSENDALSSAAYVLFYRRQTD